MTTTRILPPAEWPRLLETGCNLLQAHQHTMLGGHVLVEENARGEIIGTAFVMVAVHIDGLWVRQDVPERHDVPAARPRGHAHGARGERLTRLRAVKNPHLEEWLARTSAPSLTTNSAFQW
jgi:hypothetical protein